MSSSQPQQGPTPELVFETLTAFQRSASLKAAIELDLFTAIEEGNDNTAAIAKRIGGTERGTRILCDYLTVLGFIEKADGRYKLAPVSALFLNRRSPAYLGTAATFLSQLNNRHFFDNIAEIVRNGHNPAGETGTLGPDDDIWVDFAHSMGPMIMMPAQFIAEVLGVAAAGPLKVLDIAAGHGLFGITIAQKNPQAEVWAADWANVLQVADANARKFGVAERLHTIPGSAFDADFGSGYDVALMTNFLHHFNPATCETLLRKVRAALKPGGRLVTLEFVPNPDRITPPMAASFSMTMLATTPEGDAYTFAELDAMLKNAGFAKNELHPVPSSPESIVVSS